MALANGFVTFGPKSAFPASVGCPPTPSPEKKYGPRHARLRFQDSERVAKSKAMTSRPHAVIPWQPLSVTPPQTPSPNSITQKSVCASLITGFEDLLTLDDDENDNQENVANSKTSRLFGGDLGLRSKSRVQLGFTCKSSDETAKPVNKKPLNLAEKFSSGERVLARRLGRVGHPKSNYPLGICCDEHPNGTGNIYVCDLHHHEVSIYGPSGSFVKTFGSRSGGRHNWRPSQFHRPSGVIVRKDGAVFVKDMHRIQQFDREGVYVKAFGADVLTEPFGLALNSYDHLVTIDIRPGNKPHLCIFGEDGDLFHERSLEMPPGETGRDLARSKYRFLGIYEDQVYVVDLGLNRVVVYDYDGHFLRTFGAGGTSRGCFNDAAGITFDAVGNSVVADSRNSRLQAFDTKGKYLGVIATADTVRRPSSILINKEGHIFVASIWEKCVKKFAL